MGTVYYMDTRNKRIAIKFVSLYIKAGSKIASTWAQQYKLTKHDLIELRELIHAEFKRRGLQVPTK